MKGVLPFLLSFLYVPTRTSKLTFLRCSCYFQRIEPLRWVPYFEECLQLLEKTREHPTDILLVFLARLQLIKNAIYRDMSDNFSGGIASPPSEIYFKSLQSQLEELKRNIPPELDGNSEHSHFQIQFQYSHATQLAYSFTFTTQFSLYTNIVSAPAQPKLPLQIPLRHFSSPRAFGPALTLPNPGSRFLSPLKFYRSQAMPKCPWRSWRKWHISL